MSAGPPATVDDRLRVSADRLKDASPQEIPRSCPNHITGGQNVATGLRKVNQNHGSRENSCRATENNFDAEIPKRAAVKYLK
jgi:hypothetical protein